MMKKVMKTLLDLAMAFVCGGAWAIEPVVKWDGDLAAGEKNGYTLSYRNDDNQRVAFANGQAVLKQNSAVSHGLIVSWDSNDASTIQSQEMTVLVKYYGYTGTAYHSLFAALWESASKETVIFSNGEHTKIGISKGVTTGNSGDQVLCEEDNVSAPAAGIMMVTFANVEGELSGTRVAFAPASGAGYGPFELKFERSDVKYSEKFKGLKIGGTIGSNSHYYRPGMKITGLAIYERAMTLAEAQRLPEFTSSTVQYSHPAVLQSDFVSTGWKVSSVDELVNWNFSGEMIGNSIGGKPVAARGCFPVKHTDGTVKVEFQASNGETKGVSAIFRVVNGVVEVKGKAACYFGAGNRVGESMFNNDGSRNTSITVNNTLATSFTGGGYGIQNILATPNYYMSNAASGRDKSDYSGKSFTFNLPVAHGYATGSKVVVKSVGLATEGSNKDLPAQIEINGVKSSSRVGPISDPTIQGHNSVTGYMITYNFTEPLVLTVGTAATSFKFLNADGVDVTSGNIRFAVASRSETSPASTGMKLSALAMDGESSWVPVCTVVGVPVDDWYFGKGSEYWKNVYQGPAAGVDANFNSADQWLLASGATKAAMYSGSSNWEPALVNGDLLANIEKGGDGYKTIATGTTDLDGWSLKLGLVNNVKLSVNKIGKLQDNSLGGTLFVGVDATSKLYVAQYGNGNCQGAITFDVASEEGVEFNCNADVGNNKNTATINYILRGNGSMKINGSYNIGASHKVSHVELELGSGEYVVLKERKLVGFTSSNISDANISFDTNPEIVIVDNEEIEGGVYTGSEASLNDCLGKARIVKKTDGIYAQYFGYGDTQTTAALAISGLPENVEVASVVANEVTITPEGDGTYVVPLGAPITISYTTTVDNKVPAFPSKVFAGILADTTISTGHPTAIDFPKILWGSDTNTDYLSKDAASPTLLFVSQTSLADIASGNAKLIGKIKGEWVTNERDLAIAKRDGYTYVEGSNIYEIQCQMYDGKNADKSDYYTKVQNVTLYQIKDGDNYYIFATGSQGYYLGDGTDRRGTYIEKTATGVRTDTVANSYEVIKIEIDQTSEGSYNGKNYASIIAAIAAAEADPGHGAVTLQANTAANIVVPSGVVLELNNHTISGQVRVEFGGWITENDVVKIDGFTTSFDIAYADKITFDYQQESKAISNIGSGEASYFQGNTQNTLHGIYLKHQPYIGSIPESFFTSTYQLTMAVVGTLPAAHNTIFAHMGSAADGYNGIFLATGANDNEVVVAYNNGASATTIATMTVPNAATARHLYIITKSDTADKASFTVYLDGDEFTTQTFDKFIIKGGYQLGRTFNTHVAGFDTVADDSTAYVNVFRAYDRVISQAEINRYKEVYQYKSIDGNYERTFATGSVDWSADNAWTRTDVDPHTQETFPTCGMVSATFAGDTAVTVNGTAATQYEKLTIAGTGTITFNKGEGDDIVKLTPVATQIMTPIVLSENTLDISGGPTTVGTNGHVTFDFSGLTEAAVASAYPFAQKVTGMTSATSDKFTLTPTTIGRVALSLEQRDDKCYYVVGTIAPMDVYYVEGYLSATAPTSPTFKDADDHDINFYAGDTLIIGSKVKTGVVGAWIADDFVGTKFKIEKDFAFHSGVEATILDGATISVDGGKTLTINNYNSKKSVTLGDVTFNGAKVVIDAEIPAGAITGTATVELSSNGTLVPTSIANALTGQGAIKLVQAQTNSDSALNTWLTSEQLANFKGTIWCAKGRFKSSTPVPNAITIKVTNGAKFYINAASTWNNHFVLSGLGWSGDGTYKMGPTALRFENANCKLGESAILEFVEETVDGQAVTPAVGVQNCNPVVAATLKGTCGFRLLAENASTFEFTKLLSSNEFTGSVTLNANCSLKTSTDFPVARVLSGVEGNVIKEVLGEDDTVVYSLVGASEDHPITPDSGDVVIPVVPDAGIAIQPGADVTVPTTTDASKIEVKYGDTVLSGNDGVVAVAVNAETGKIELSIKPEKENEVRPTVNAMAAPTEASTDKVAFTITSPIPGLFYAVSSCDTPDGTFESATGDQATSGDAKTVSIPMTFTDGKKVKYYKVSVKATK